ncbi:hypothetical protein [Gulosibacter sp. 10]|uniref:hypothetical protein n=1 Tax=Gulosibacter sp. 10 TaxID=1255570 RepID=UPI00111C9C6F|nr:hypothetical protein [Gulosibacter sp. 10]
MPTITTAILRQVAHILREGEEPKWMQPARCIESEIDLEDDRFENDEEPQTENLDAESKVKVTELDPEDDRFESIVQEQLDGGSYLGCTGCLAAGLRKALEVPTSEILVTDQRLIVVDVNGVDEAELEWEVDRTAILHVWRRSRFLEPGRVVIAFKDGSVLALHVGLLGGKSACKLVEAIH